VSTSVPNSRHYPGQGHALLVEEDGAISVEWTPADTDVCSRVRLGAISHAEAWLKFERIAGLSEKTLAPASGLHAA